MQIISKVISNRHIVVRTVSRCNISGIDRNLDFGVAIIIALVIIICHYHHSIYFNLFSRGILFRFLFSGEAVWKFQ